MIPPLIDVARKRVKQEPRMVFNYILIASYAYYIRYESIFEDSSFDKICSYALIEYDNIDSPYKHLVTRDALQAGSCYHLKYEDYPDKIVYIAEQIITHQHMEKVNATK